jgi:hypothetical protein
MRQAHHMILWICIDWSRKQCLHRRRINTRLPLCTIRNLAFTLSSRRQCPTCNGTKIQCIGWCSISYWHNPTALGTPRLRGSRKPHAGFHGCQRSRNKRSTMTLKGITSHTPSYVRAEPNMVISRWI